MDEVIVRATNAINQILESSPLQSNDSDKTELIAVRNLLSHLHTWEFVNNRWTRLFYQQLTQSMNCNDLLSYDFWIMLPHYILRMLEEPNDEQHMCAVWDQFLDQINFDKQLEQRELQFYCFVEKQKNLNELFHEHKEFFDKYLQKCISFHSKVRVQSLIENLDDFLGKCYGLTEVSLTEKNRERLNEKINCIEIPLNCSKRALKGLEVTSFKDGIINNVFNNDPNSFLPSKQTKIDEYDKAETFEDILGRDRWIVILGDPGSAKTSLLRWITHVFAEAGSRNEQNVYFNEDYCLPVRIPILIRIGEFAIWLNENQTKSLFDYIGEHTWFSERYCDDDKSVKVLRELIYQGHCLFLLDGLDEIPNVQRRCEIIDLVANFVDEYVRAPNFTSAFDRIRHKNISLNLHAENADALFPRKSGCNQLVVTSRIVGYQFRPLDGLGVRHYSLMLFGHEEANEFVNTLMRQVDKSIYDILSNEGIQFDEETIKISLEKRNHIEEVLLKNSSEELKYTPSLLSLICMLKFQLPVELNLKCRVQMYYHVVQALFRVWKTKEPNISESVLNNFLVDLAFFLHSQSPSGLIDTFDIEHLCSLSLRQQKLSGDRRKLREYTTKILSFLESTNTIIAEKGLQVFGFLHLSFQEYFVAQAFVKASSVEDVAKRMLLFTNNSRFHESLFLAISWISWTWTFDKYNQFCNLFVAQPENQSIPFGALLFFDAIKDIYRLPSNSVIFIALNNILNHPYDKIRKRYLITSLCQLPNDIIIEWMQLTLTNEISLLRFCQSFRTNIVSYKNPRGNRSISPIIFRQLWSFRNQSSSAKFVVDQSLRKKLKSNDISDQIFNEDLWLYFVSNNLSVSTIHPLILSAVIIICGGLSCTNKKKNILKIVFNPRQMHHESFSLIPILEYLNNNRESHSTKLHKIIKQYENIIKQSSPSDTSIEIVDTFMALICLQGLSQPLIYEKYDKYQALPLALERFKHTWFYLMDTYDWTKNSFYSGVDLTFLRSKIESISKVFSLQSDRSKKQLHSISVACESAWKKLVMKSRKTSNYCNDRHNSYFQYYPEFQYLMNEKELNKIIQSSNLLKNDPFFVLNFLPQSLQQLYYHMIISPTTDTDSLPLVVFLIECLIRVENIDVNYLHTFLTFPILQLLFKEHRLDNYALVVFWKMYEDTDSLNEVNKKFLKKLKDCHLLDSFLINQPPSDWEILINEERQRIYELKSAIQNQQKDIQLFSASICLARLFQTRYYSRKDIRLNLIESQEIYLALMNILDPVLRLIAISIILCMKPPLIFDEEQRDKLRWQTINLLKDTLPDMSLIKSTFLFIQCHTLRQVFPMHFQHFANIIGNKLNEIPMDGECRKHEVSYIALRQLNNFDLSKYLAKFAQQTENLSDVLHFNSTVFYQYFAKKTSFKSLNSILLSSMYLVELIFDAQILNMYTLTTKKIIISPMTQFKNLQEDSLKYGKIMTFEIALWVTNHLNMLNKEEISQILEYVSNCAVIERKALSVINKWFDYRIDKDLRFLAHYAAVQLVIEGSNIPGLIDIIEDIFKFFDHDYCLKTFVERFFTSQSINISILRQILIKLHQNIHYSSKIFVWIDRREILDLILSLELDRIISDVDQSSKISTKSFFLIVKGCSKDLQVYLAEHLRKFTSTYNEIKNNIKEIYVAVVIKWIIERLILSETKNIFPINLYKDIFVLLHDHRFPQIQKAIVNGLNSVFICYDRSRKDIFKEDDIIINLEKIISSWNEYSQDVVALCLLAYGNCLLRLQRLEINRDISDEITIILLTISETSSSEIISIRAKFCIIFLQQSNMPWHTVSIWFRNDLNMTNTMIYQILFQQSLYKMNKLLSFGDKNKFVFTRDFKGEREIIEHIETHYTELLDTFVIDLYDYLSNQYKNNYLSDPVPNYIELASILCARKPEAFCDAVRNSSFGEKKFKRSVCLHYENNPLDSESSLKLFSVFGVITIELLDMMKHIKYDRHKSFLWLKDLKEVSDEEVINKLLELMRLTTSHINWLFFKQVLEHLIEIDAVSLLEIHQRISFINNVPYKDGDGFNNTSDYTLDLLIDFSCLKGEFLRCSENFFSETDINEAFEREIQMLDKTSRLLPKENRVSQQFSINCLPFKRRRLSRFSIRLLH